MRALALLTGCLFLTGCIEITLKQESDPYKTEYNEPYEIKEFDGIIILFNQQTGQAFRLTRLMTSDFNNEVTNANDKVVAWEWSSIDHYNAETREIYQELFGKKEHSAE
jgi:hypothetical protein